MENWGYYVDENINSVNNYYHLLLFLSCYTKKIHQFNEIEDFYKFLKNFLKYENNRMVLYQDIKKYLENYESKNKTKDKNIYLYYCEYFGPIYILFKNIYLNCKEDLKFLYLENTKNYEFLFPMDFPEILMQKIYNISQICLNDSKIPKIRKDTIIQEIEILYNRN